MSKSKYIIFYKNPEHESVYYGWTFSKSIVKAFLSQRKKNLYKVRKLSDKEIEYIDGIEDETSSRKMIEILKLQSNKTNKIFILFITANEMQEMEQQIQNYFIDLCTFKNMKNPNGCMNIFVNLKDKYIDALEMIGYRPPECDILFPPNEQHDANDVKSFISDQLSDIYNKEYPLLSMSDDYYYDGPPGLSVLEDPSTKIIYSIESFIKVMKDVLI